MNRLQNILAKFLKTNKGFTLVEVMIASAVMGGLGLVMMEITKQQSTQGVEYQITADVAQMKADVQSILSNPANCNANFFQKVGGTSTPVAIYKCSSFASGGCSGSGAPVAYINVNNASWTNTGSMSSRVRLSALSMYVQGMQASGANRLTFATLTATFQKKTMKTTKSENFTFSIPVIYDGTKVVGCPKSWNSTVPF